jgi:hypothetical protein
MPCSRAALTSSTTLGDLPFCRRALISSRIATILRNLLLEKFFEFMKSGVGTPDVQ